MTNPPDPAIQRTATRAPVGKPIKLQFDDTTELIEGFCSNISIGGMFIKVHGSRPQGSLVRFELMLDESSAIRGLGEVVWMRTRDGGPGREPGVGIKFRFLEQRDRQLIFKLVSQYIKERLARRPPMTLSPSVDMPPPVQEGMEALVPPSPKSSSPTAGPPKKPSGAPASGAPPEHFPLPKAPLKAPSDRGASGVEVPNLQAQGFDTIPRDTAPRDAIPQDTVPHDSASPDETRQQAPDVSEDVTSQPIVTKSEPATDRAANSVAFDSLEPADREAIEIEEPRLHVEPELRQGRRPTQLEDPELETVTPPWASQTPLHVAKEESDEEALAMQSKSRLSPILAIPLLLLLAFGVAVFFYRDVLFDGGQEGSEPYPSGPPPTAVRNLEEQEKGGGDPSADADAERQALGGSPTEEEAPATSAAPISSGNATEPSASTEATADFTRVTDVTWSKTAQGVRVIFQGDGVIRQGRYTYFRLPADPPREVVRFLQVSRGFNESPLTIGGPAVRQIRTGYHQKSTGRELHVVFDLLTPAAKIVDVQTVGSTLEVLLENE